MCFSRKEKLFETNHAGLTHQLRVDTCASCTNNFRKSVKSIQIISTFILQSLPQGRSD